MHRAGVGGLIATGLPLGNTQLQGKESESAKGLPVRWRVRMVCVTPYLMTQPHAVPNAESSETLSGPEQGLDGVYRLLQPVEWRLPLVLASPHSGRDYPADFTAQSRLDGVALRRSEDCFVDEIFAPAVALGAPLLTALFPRAYLDPNREPFEFDPGMFDGPLPSYVNSRSPRVAAGLGTVPRIVASGEEIYRTRLRFADAVARVERCYYPYHAALRRLVEATRARFGYCILLDCHSMPSIGLPPEIAECGAVDMVLGDCYGSACSPALMAAADECLSALGYVVGRNIPYAGGYTTRHYGRPSTGIHTLQIELNRSLYMDEVGLCRRPYLGTLSVHMGRLVAALGDLSPALLRPRR